MKVGWEGVGGVYHQVVRWIVGKGLMSGRGGKEAVGDEDSSVWFCVERGHRHIRTKEGR